MTGRTSAQTIGELDIHVGNLQEAVRELRLEVQRANSAMVTKEDLADLKQEMQKFATKAELQQAREEFARTSLRAMAKNVVVLFGGIGVVFAGGHLIIKIIHWAGL